MKRQKLIFPVLLPLLLLLAACERKEIIPAETEEDMAELCVKIRTPKFNYTKAASSSEESVFKQLYIWVFLSETGECIGYITPKQDTHLQTENEDRYFIRISREIALAKPDVDIYVLGNHDALGLQWGWGVKTSRATLDEYVLSGSLFGLQDDGTPVYDDSSISSKGIPFSAVGKHISMEGTYPSLTTPTVTLKRAVSKFRVIVSQLSDAVGPVLSFNLDKISLNSGLIASEEYLFNDSGNDYKLSGYVDKETVLPVPAYADIAQNPSPQDYAYHSGLDMQDYEDLVQEGIDEGVLTEIGPYYLRESDQALSGTITYTMGSEQKSVPFSMDSAGGFSRNHSWIIYIYFLRDQMEFTVTWTDWQFGAEFDLSE